MIFKKIYASSLFKNSLIYILSDALNKAIPFLILPILAKYLLPASYSIISNYAVFVTLLSIFIGFSSQGLISITYYRVSKEQVSKYTGNLFIIIIITIIFSAILFYIFQDQLFTILPIGFNYILLGVFVAAFTTISSINTSIWRLEEKPIPFGVYQVSQTLINVILSLILIIFFLMDWEGRIIGLGATGIIYGIISVVILFRKKIINFRYDKEIVVELLKYGIPLMPHMLSLWIKTGIDRTLVTKLCGDTANGIFVVGTQFGLIVSFLILSFHNAYVPFLYKKLSENDESVLSENKNKIVRFSYLYLSVILVVCILATIVSILFIRYYLNENYQDAIKYVPWAIFSQFFQTIYLLFISYLFFVKKTGVVSSITFICGIIHVFSSYFFIKYFGPIGASCAALLSIALNAIIVAIVSNKYVKLPWFGKQK